MSYTNLKYIKTGISDIINSKFPVLLEKNILADNVFLVVQELAKYYMTDTFEKQLLKNDGRDLMSIVVLLLPYYDLNTSHKLTSLNEIINGKDISKELYKSTYYIDHDPTSLSEYFTQTIKMINMTLQITANKLMPNWTTIQPLKLQDFNENKLSKNLVTLYLEKKFDKTNCDLQYPTLYGTCAGFLYNDIKKLKWIIYDVFDGSAVFPTIILLSHDLNWNNWKPYNLLTDEEKEYIKTKWANVINSNLYLYRSLLLFYIGYVMPSKEKSNAFIELELSLMRYYSNAVDLDISKIVEHENFEKYYDQDTALMTILTNIVKLTTFEDIYAYVIMTMQQFTYTFYAQLCMKYDEVVGEYIVLSKKEYLDTTLKFLNETTFKNIETKNLSITNTAYCHFTPKMMYNYFKFLVCRYDESLAKTGNTFGNITNSTSWFEMDEKSQSKIIDKLNGKEEFGIPKNFHNLYGALKNNSDGEKTVNTMYYKLMQYVKFSSVIPKIIYTCLCINGILTEFRPNEKLVGNGVPDAKNRPTEWKEYMMQHTEIYGYNFTTNTLYTDENKEIIKQNGWYNLFSTNWICQIQQFHHFIHSRVLITTGGTGTGKSTVFPLMMLYAYKAIDYKNDAKIFCTQPRILPTVGNANRINAQIGFGKITNEKRNNILQYSTGDEKITDSNYHPLLRFYTDRSLVNIILNNFLLKVKTPSREHTAENLVDMVLVDESHENNTNMTLILTLLKFAGYVNNSVTIGIISATMEYDEVVYRKYYECIDDNYKYPLNYGLVSNNINRKFLDRRMHLSVPFGDTNFDIIEYHNYIKSPDNYINITKILKEIFNNPDTGDILIFQIGEKEILTLVRALNSDKDIPKNVLAVPYYRSIGEKNKDLVMNLGKQEYRDSFKNPKNRDVFEEIPVSEQVKTPYSRFILVTTNIAEASITIDTLSYVIDNGYQKINVYNAQTMRNNLITRLIATPNRIQRKGRVGRIKKGVVYYTYDTTLLKVKPTYKITIEDLSDIVFNMYTKTGYIFMTPETDPYLATSKGQLPKYVLYQYLYGSKIFPYPKIANYDKMVKIVYPYTDGKYNSEQLIDENCVFYITHPNSEDLTLDNNLKVVSKSPTYINKILTAFLQLKSVNMVLFENGKYELTKEGKTILKLKNTFGDEIILLSDLFCLLHNYYIYTRQKDIRVYNELLHFILVKMSGPSKLLLNEKAFEKSTEMNEFLFRSQDILTKVKKSATVKSTNIYNLLAPQITKTTNPHAILFSKKYRDLVKTYFIQFNKTNEEIDTKIEKLKLLIAQILSPVIYQLFDDETLALSVLKFLENYYYYYIIFDNLAHTHNTNQLTFNYGITDDFLESLFTTNVLKNCSINGTLDSSKIFNNLMIKYFYVNILKKNAKGTYTPFFQSDDPQEYVLSLHSTKKKNDIVFYLDANEDGIISNLIYGLSENLLKSTTKYLKN